jgi:hypothetical protein
LKREIAKGIEAYFTPLTTCVVLSPFGPRVSQISVNRIVSAGARTEASVMPARMPLERTMAPREAFTA